jgi:hypothetical protein
MPIPSMAETKAKLSPYHGIIRSVIDEAWAEWRKVQRFREDNGFNPVLYARTISNYMFDAIARRAIPRLGAEAKVLLQTDAQTFKAYVNGVLVRVKKGGEDGLGCNWPTQTALAFEEVGGHFPGFPAETTKVEIIWLPNDIWTKVEQLLIVARDGDKMLWQYEIPADEGTGIVKRLPIWPSDPGHISGNGLIKPKVAKAKKQPKS